MIDAGYPRLLVVLNLFTQTQGRWTAEEIAKTLGEPISSVYRSLRQLKATGFLASTAGEYTLGPKIIELDYVSRQQDPVISALEEVDVGAFVKVPATITIVRNYGEKLICVYSRRLGRPPQSAYVRGKPMPLVPGAIGRSLLCHYPHKQLVAICEKNIEVLKALGWGDVAEDQARSIAALRKDPVQIAFGEVNPGVAGIAKALKNNREIPTVSVCVTVQGSVVAMPDVLGDLSNSVDALVSHMQKICE
jgi:DNA-binding IclR family transcriptional regulator